MFSNFLFSQIIFLWLIHSLNQQHWFNHLVNFSHDHQVRFIFSRVKVTNNVTAWSIQIITLRSIPHCSLFLSPSSATRILLTMPSVVSGSAGCYWGQKPSEVGHSRAQRSKGSWCACQRYEGSSNFPNAMVIEHLSHSRHGRTWALEIGTTKKPNSVWDRQSDGHRQLQSTSHSSV